MILSGIYLVTYVIISLRLSYTNCSSHIKIVLFWDNIWFHRNNPECKGLCTNNKNCLRVCGICHVFHYVKWMSSNRNIEDYIYLFQFDLDDVRPQAVCSFCYQKLLKCHTFSKMVQKSEQIFTELIREGHEVCIIINYIINKIK